MAQADYVVANGTGAAVRSDLNGQLAAIVSNNSGATEPATMYAYQWWADTTAGLLKLRNSANSAWITMRQLDGEFSTVPVENGTAAAPSIYFKDSGTDSGFFSPGTDAVAISTAGTNRLHITSGGLVGIGSTAPQNKLVVSNAGAEGVEVRPGDTSNAVDFLAYNRSTAAYSDLQSLAATHRWFIAGNEAARIDSSSRLLVGTSTSPSVGVPASALFVVQGYTGAPTGDSLISLQRGQAPASITSGAQLGAISFGANDGSPYAQIHAATDGAGAANDYPGRLIFSTTADGGSSPTERLRINSSGQILYGTTTKNITSPNNTGFEINVLNTNGLGFYVANALSNNTSVVFQNTTGRVGFIDINASSVTYNTSSDYRLKENITLLDGAITRLKQLPVHRFNFIADPDHTVDGFIAHEAQAVVPECVTGEKDEVDADDNPVHQGIDQSKLVPLLTAALQEAIGRIETLEAEVSTLKGA
jgi:hypothetical protein